MTTINIFSEAEIQAFENPPIFTGEERKKYFRITRPIQRALRKLRTPYSQIGLLLHLGYYRKTNRFYDAKRFHENDLTYIKGILNVPPDTDMSLYDRKLFNKHKKIILDILGNIPHRAQKDDFDKQIRHLVLHRTQPKEIIFQMQHWCRLKKVELCSYDTIAKTITKEINVFEKWLYHSLREHLTSVQRRLLDDLIEDPLLDRLYPFNHIRKIITDDSYKKIKESLVHFQRIRHYYHQLLPVIEALDLPVDTFRSYGLWLSKAKKFQVVRLNNRYLRYLHLISFIHFQFHLWQDAYVTILLKFVHHYHRLAKKSHDDYRTDLNVHKKKKGTDQVHQRYPIDPLGEQRLWRQTCNIMETVTFTPTEKLGMITEMVSNFRTELQQGHQGVLPPMVPMEVPEKVVDTSGEKSVYDFLVTYQRRLTMRVSPIIKHLTFDNVYSEEVLVTAIDTYTDYDQIVRPEVYTVLFNKEENDALIDDKGRFRAGLCKVLFYGKIADAIRSGSLNLKHSYKYLAVDKYLIDKVRWENEKDRLMARAGLSGYTSVGKVLDGLKSELDKQYRVVHERFVMGRNPYLSYRKIDGVNRPKVRTPPLPDRDNKVMATLFEDTKYVMLPQILADIQEATGFVNCFEHHNIKHKRPRPDDKVFFATLIGQGCNLGAGKMRQITQGIEGGTISNTLNWYFSLENILKANDKIVAMIDKMALSDVFRKNPWRKATSSDGQKFNVAVPSLQATYSIKYFGTGKGVSVYSFINDKYALFYNTVITSSEREAPYVIDGILHNDTDRVEQLERERPSPKEHDIDWQHSTDTHGFTEVIFGATHLLDITFAPRLKEYYKQTIYGFEKPAHYKQKGYFWLPKRTINTGLIAEQWDDIMRLMTSIRLREVPASIVLKRLNSYARQNPLYKGLKEFGRIIKTIFLLRYIDDVTLRQHILYQLNMVELSHQFAKAVFYGRSGAFHEAIEEKQKVVAACRMLIQNNIVLWNYMYLSKKIMKCETAAEVERIFKIVREGAMITWQHVHLEGTYDFKQDFPSNFSTVQMAEMLDMNLEEFIRVAA